MKTQQATETQAVQTVSTESVPEIWDDERDVPFFAMTAQLFSHEFAAGASVLLASYDEDEDAESTQA